MALDLGPLKAVVQDLVAAAESVGADVVNQQAGIAQEDLDGLTNALKGVHQKLATAAPPAQAVSVPIGEAAQGEAAAGQAGWTPPPPPAPEG
jgi:hypothetical protein